MQFKGCITDRFIINITICLQVGVLFNGTQIDKMHITFDLNLQDETTKGEHVTTLIFCICGPLAYNWFMSFMKTLFGGKEWPSFKSFLIVSKHFKTNQLKAPLQRMCG